MTLRCFPSYLCHLINGCCHTGNLTRYSVLVVYTLRTCHGHLLGSALQSLGSCLLISVLDRFINLLNLGLNAGTDCLVTLGLGASYKDSLLS